MTAEVTSAMFARVRAEMRMSETNSVVNMKTQKCYDLRKMIRITKHETKQHYPVYHCFLKNKTKQKK